MRRPLRLRRGALRVTLALALLVAAQDRARATSSDCVRVPDGSPCSTDCRVDGVCRAGNCIGGTPEPDGTACATGRICTMGDTCMLGVCRAGVPVVCGPDPCGPAQCVEGVGCLPIVACDMAQPVDLAGPDLASRPVDLASPGDLASPPSDGNMGPFDANIDDPPDLSVTGDAAVPVDLAQPPGDAGVPDGGEPDLAVVVDGGEPDGGEPDLAAADLAGLDLAGSEDDLGGEPTDAGDEGIDPDGGVIIGLHVHGSGCALDGRAPGTAPAWLLLGAAVVALVARRRRGGGSRS